MLRSWEPTACDPHPGGAIGKDTVLPATEHVTDNPSCFGTLPTCPRPRCLPFWMWMLRLCLVHRDTVNCPPTPPGGGTNHGTETAPGHHGDQNPVWLVPLAGPTGASAGQAFQPTLAHMDTPVAVTQKPAPRHPCTAQSLHTSHPSGSGIISDESSRAWRLSLSSGLRRPVTSRHPLRV